MTRFPFPRALLCVVTAVALVAAMKRWRRAVEPVARYVESDDGEVTFA